MLIIPSPYFEKKLKRIPIKIYRAFQERVLLFREEPYNPLLHNHALYGKRKHQRSINITGNWRLIYEPVNGKAVRLIDIDTHANLYE